MIDNEAWSIRASSPSLDVAVASSEPSHIHIPRPSRGLRNEITRHVAHGLARLACHVELGGELRSVVSNRAAGVPDQTKY